MFHIIQVLLTLMTKINQPEAKVSGRTEGVRPYLLLRVHNIYIYNGNNHF